MCYIVSYNPYTVPDMPFREISAWISLMGFLVVYGSYFASIAKEAGQVQEPVFGGRLIGTIVTLVIVQVVLHILVAVWTPRDADAPMDERERLIDLKAANVAHFVLIGGVLAACVQIGMNMPAFYTANTLFFYLVLSEVVRSATAIFHFRRGA